MILPMMKFKNSQQKSKRSKQKSNYSLWEKLSPLMWLISILIFSTNSFALSVVIDPGHGGTDTGAKYGSAKESAIALQVSKILKKLLENEKSIQTSLTRDTDQSLTLPERVHIAEKKKADLFISIHLNASRNAKAQGVEFYFQNQLEPDEETLYLANLENQKNSDLGEAFNNDKTLTKKGDVAAIIEDLRRTYKMGQSHLLSQKLFSSWSQQLNIGKDSNPIRQAPFYVISKTKIPSVLVELGFLSNPKEADKLNNPNFQAQIAQSLYKGLMNYKEMIDNSQARSLQ